TAGRKVHMREHRVARFVHRRSAANLNYVRTDRDALVSFDGDLRRSRRYGIFGRFVPAVAQHRDDDGIRALRNALEAVQIGDIAGDGFVVGIVDVELGGIASNPDDGVAATQSLLRDDAAD